MKSIQYIIPLPERKGFKFIEPGSVMRCEARGQHTLVYMLTGENVLFAKSLEFMEELLTEYSFVRVHDAHLINTEYVSFYLQENGGFVMMKDGAEIKITRNKRNMLLKRMEAV